MANTGKMNLLEEEGRIKSEPQTKNVKAEEKRVVGEIKKGYKTGGRVGFRHGKYVRTPTPHADISKYMFNKKEESPRKRDELSTMKMPKKKKQGPKAGPMGRPKGGWSS